MEKPETKESNLISCNAAVGACGKASQWRGALAVLRQELLQGDQGEKDTLSESMPRFQISERFASAGAQP